MFTFLFIFIFFSLYFPLTYFLHFLFTSWCFYNNQLELSPQDGSCRGVLREPYKWDPSNAEVCGSSLPLPPDSDCVYWGRTQTCFQANGKFPCFSLPFSPLLLLCYLDVFFGLFNSANFYMFLLFTLLQYIMYWITHSDCSLTE